MISGRGGTMGITTSRRLSELSEYAFAEVRRKVEELQAKGVHVIDFGVGDPSEPTPKIVREAIKRAVDKHAAGGYPSYVGSSEYREAIAAWTKRRFGVLLDPEKEICATIGSKEAIFNFAEAIVNPGDVVIVPNPSYPPYARGTRFAEGEVYYVNLRRENGFLPDLNEIPPNILKRAKLMWINYPNNPTGAVAPMSFLKQAAEFGKKHGIIIASDEAYSENYCDAPAHSILEIARERVLVFQSLSKRSCMTGYRVGWLAGDAEIVAAFKKLKTNIDSGTPTFIQDAAIAALSDEKHVQELRDIYNKKRALISDAFAKAGLPKCGTGATLHLWQRVPEKMTSLEFAEKLLDPRLAIVAMPGSLLAENTPSGNPGEGYVRLSLSSSVEECKVAAERIRKHLPDLLK